MLYIIVMRFAVVLLLSQLLTRSHHPRMTSIEPSVCFHCKPLQCTLRRRLAHGEVQAANATEHADDSGFAILSKINF